MPVRKNADMGVLNSYNSGTQYSMMHGPFENFGVFNGQFEQGPSGSDESEQPEGWIFVPGTDAGAQIFRATEGYCGKWCACGGNAGTGRGGTLETQKFLPVNSNLNYYAQVVARSDGGALGRLTWRLLCYDADKALLGSQTLYNAVPGAAWTLLHYEVGPNFGTAFAYAARYVRMAFDLQSNAARTNQWVRVDDIKFQPIQRWQWA